MKWKWAVFFLFLLGVLVLPCIWISKSFCKGAPPQKTQHVKCTYGSYFIPINISKFTAANQPCISAKINDRTVSLMLDLGLRGQFSFSPQFLSGIENKTYLRSKKMYGIRGTEYKEKIFEVPEITIGSMTFSHPNIHECAERFHADATLMKKDDELSTPEPGKAGWELFGNTNLFLDLRNSKIAFCDSLSTLENHGYKITNFTKTPLLLERGLVEFEIETPQGCLRCMLDTGATWNILNTEIEEGRSIEQVMRESSNILEYLSFKIGTQDFGPIAFHCMPIKIPIHIEAILGMEFFEDHLVFLDFADNYVYFLKKAVQP
jgi:hypothetical protein